MDWSSSTECSAEDHWNQSRSGIMSSAEESRGKGCHSNLEWFEDNVDMLKPLIYCTGRM